ncbi:ABC transporter substrate-binding protein [Advenella sp. RU8]|jgi:peptide/nickel transport system substrate-binding protein|uniref:ABC transporter substrate-binding protein n=1 Tax=unclassified Advenella TaxID=2685285 RepID=UPI00145CE8E9|nr:ABC transporter substrate-binding protein [Advenella sp. EE-W14]NLN67930.1 ABC transporter substrate-binding protein [Alcaligenaceae bacterium]
MKITRRGMLLISTAFAFSSPFFSGQLLAQPVDDRPVITVAVQQVVNSGSLDPLREQSNVGGRVLPMIYSGLIEVNATGDMSQKPGIAESWKRIDNNTVELKLRKGVKFHNGEELTAEDVAFSFGPERMFGKTQPRRAENDNKTIAVDYGKKLATVNTKTTIEPPPEVVAIARRLWPSVEEVKVIDDYTVHLVNAVPDLTLEGRLTRVGAEIVSKKAYLSAEDWNSWARNPVSAGPFKVKEFKPDQYLILEAHDEYFGGKPNVKEIRYVVVPEVSSRINGLLSGQYDFVTDVPSDQIKTIEANGKFEVVGGPVLNHRIVVFDKNHPVLANPKVRQAMTHAIDREAIVQALWDGRTSVPAGLQWEYYGDMFLKDWTVPEYNPELAKKLLKEAGYNGEPIPYRILNNYYGNQTQTAQVLVEMWRAVGLNIELQMKENWPQVSEKTNRGARDWSNSATFSDPVSSLVNQHGPNGQQQQNGEWANEEFNKLSLLLETSVDPEERKATFRRMLEISEREDPAYTVLYGTAVFYGKRKDIDWKWSPNFMMDFRAENVTFK